MQSLAQDEIHYLRRKQLNRVNNFDVWFRKMFNSKADSFLLHTITGKVGLVFFCYVKAFRKLFSGFFLNHLILTDETFFLQMSLLVQLQNWQMRHFRGNLKLALNSSRRKLLSLSLSHFLSLTLSLSLHTHTPTHPHTQADT